MQSSGDNPHFLQIRRDGERNTPDPIRSFFRPSRVNLTSLELIPLKKVKFYSSQVKSHEFSSSLFLISHTRCLGEVYPLSSPYFDPLMQLTWSDWSESQEKTGLEFGNISLALPSGLDDSEKSSCSSPSSHFLFTVYYEKMMMMKIERQTRTQNENEIFLLLSSLLTFYSIISWKRRIEYSLRMSFSIFDLISSQILHQEEKEISHDIHNEIPLFSWIKLIWMMMHDKNIRSVLSSHHSRTTLSHSFLLSSCHSVRIRREGRRWESWRERETNACDDLSWPLYRFIGLKYKTQHHHHHLLSAAAVWIIIMILLILLLLMIQFCCCSSFFFPPADCCLTDAQEFFSSSSSVCDGVSAAETLPSPFILSIFSSKTQERGEERTEWGIRKFLEREKERGYRILHHHKHHHRDDDYPHSEFRQFESGAARGATILKKEKREEHHLTLSSLFFSQLEKKNILL